MLGAPVKTVLFSALRSTARLLGRTRIQRVWPLSVANRVVFRALKPDRAMVLGHEMFLDPNDSLKLSLHGIYEPLETRIVREHLEPGAVFVDVGANIGYYTLLAARAVGPTGRVYAFEPEPDNFRLLQKNVAHAGYTNVTMFQKAVSERRGTLKLYFSEDNRGDHRLYDSGEGRRSIDVEVVALDEILEGVERVNLVKMDIQGAEAGALAGMSKLLERSPGVELLTELWPWGMARFGRSATELLDRLGDLGFSLSEVDEEHGTLAPTSREVLLSRYSVENERFTNLHAVRR